MFGWVFYINLCAVNLAWFPVASQDPMAVTVEQQAPARGESVETGALNSPSLGAPFPNPFNSGTTIVVALERAQFVQIRVLDLRGRVVRPLLAESLPAGPFEVAWDGTNEQGSPVPSGTYFCEVSSGGASTTRRMTLLK
jgi:hypothetical protein